MDQFYYNQDKINDIYKDLIYKDTDYTVKNKNEYFRDYDFIYVKNVEEMDVMANILNSSL